MKDFVENNTSKWYSINLSSNMINDLYFLLYNFLRFLECHQKTYQSLELLCIAWWECKIVQPLWKTVQQFLKKLNTEIPCYPAISLVGMVMVQSKVMSDSCNPMDCSLPGSSVHGILPARILEWVAISFCRGSSRLRNRTWVS